MHTATLTTPKPKNVFANVKGGQIYRLLSTTVSGIRRGSLFLVTDDFGVPSRHWHLVDLEDGLSYLPSSLDTYEFELVPSGSEIKLLVSQP